MLSRKRIYLLLAGLCFAAYANSLNGGFVSDDIAAILHNSRIQFLLHLDVQDFLNAFIWRIVKFNVIPYHLVSLILHFLNTILVLLFLRLFFKEEPSFLSAALFAVHPVHTEAVTWISGRPYLIFTFFILSVYLLYYKAANSEEFNPSTQATAFSRGPLLRIPPRGRKREAPWALPVGLHLREYILALVIFSVSIIESNLFGLFLPAFIILSDIVFGHWRKNWKLWLPFVCLSVFRLILALGPLHKRISLQVAVDGGEYLRLPILPFMYSLSSNLGLLFWPVKLTLYHSPPVFSFLRFWFSLILLSFYIFFSPYIFKKAKVVFFGAALFILFLAPTYSPITITGLVVERYLYFASILLCIAAAFLYERYFTNVGRARKYFAFCLFAFIIIAYGVRTIARNKDYKDFAAFARATLRDSPDNAQAHNNSGFVYNQMGDINKALGEFNTAIKLNPNLYEAYNNRGIIYLNRGQIKGAIADFDKVIQINPLAASVYNNRGIAYQNDGQLTQAIADFDKALQIDPYYAFAYYNRGVAYQKKGKLKEAIFDLSKALEINPDFSGALYNRAVLYFSIQDYQRSWQDIRSVQRLGRKIHPEFIEMLKKASLKET